MSRQNKQLHQKQLKIQTTAMHNASRAKFHGLKRTKQPKEGRLSIGFTKKLTSTRKGVRA